MNDAFSSRRSAGSYAVVAYGLIANDLPGDGGGLPLPSTGVTDAHFDAYEFVSAASPAFPSGGDQNNHANASLRFESKLTPLRIMPLGASITDGYLGTMAGYRGPLKKLSDDAIATVDLHSVIMASDHGDKLHPNDVGYGKVAKVFFDAIEKLDL